MYRCLALSRQRYRRRSRSVVQRPLCNKGADNDDGPTNDEKQRMESKTTILLTIKSQHDDKGRETRSLRALLKVMLRHYGWRVTAWTMPTVDAKQEPTVDLPMGPS